jgi:hypothetical protein
MDGWGEYAVIVGGASAALVGLLFVAVSIKVDLIVRSVALRARRGDRRRRDQCLATTRTTRRLTLS